jgi:hypothetical protein
LSYFIFNVNSKNINITPLILINYIKTHFAF